MPCTQSQGASPAAPITGLLLANPDEPQCDLRAPRCSACTRLDDECNIADCISYSYHEVQGLQAQISHLRDRLQLQLATEAGSRTVEDSSSQETPLLPTHTEGEHQPLQRDRAALSGDSRREAEEVGILAIGGHDLYSQNKYGRLPG